MSETATQGKLLKGLAEAFDLGARHSGSRSTTTRIFQGSHAVGAMIVAGPEGFEKSQYRKFNIKDET